MHNLLDLLFWRTWWRYDAASDWFTQPYHWLNLVEGTVWLCQAALVVQRYIHFRKSRLEPLYALAFFTFGLSDFREAYVLQSWLVLFKGANLTALLYLRWRILRRYYPQSRTY